jgi:hypothetical protein
MMSPKTFIGFTIITILVVVAASFSVATRYSVHKIGYEDKPVLPDFADKVGEVEAIIIQDAKRKLTVKRNGNNWVMADRQNYVASNEVVSDLMLGLSELRLREAKTRKAKLYSRLQVEDLKTKNAKSILLTIKGKTGDLAKLIVGKASADVVGSSNAGRYIRKPSETQSWLASGRLEIPLDVNKWVKPEFLDITSSRVENVTVIHPDGSKMIVSRAGKKKFEIRNMPKNMVVEYQSDIDNMGDGLDKLELEDVMAVGKVKFLKDKTISTRIRTNDGIVINVKMIDISDGNFWAKFDAVAGPMASDLVKKEVSAINLRVSKWVYELPAHKYRYLSRKHSDVLKDPKAIKKK